MEVFLFEVTDNFELELCGQKRKAYAKGSKILVHYCDRLRMLRLGLKEVESKELKTSEVFADAKKSK